MPIDDHTSENPPVIKSRTGKFLQGMFDKKAPARNMSRPRTTPTSSPAELLQVVPEPITWDESEETNWDDDFVEAPQPAFDSPPSAAAIPDTPPPGQPPVSPVPPPPPTAFQKAVPKVLTNPIVEQSTADNSPEAFPSEPPSFIVAKTNEVSKPEGNRSTNIEVSIPRPKNIKYKSKDPNAEPAAPAKPAKSEAIELDIQRPKNIKYKTPPPAKVSLPDRLLAPVKTLFAKISAPFDRSPKIYIEQVPADGKIPVKKKSWQLPSLGRENLRQILIIAGALFLAMTVAWAVINFWPRPSSVVAAPPAPVIQPAPVQPIISPEAALLEAVKNRSQALASLYPAGLIANLELDNQQGLATVNVGDLWFNLTPEQQQQTAQSLWQQARSYQMSGLEVRGTTDRLLARSPLVGTEAIVISQ